jgi:hypothetical protein
MGMALMSTGYARVDKAPTFKTDPYPFVENLGQLADPEGRPLTEAYFTFEAPGMRGYVTRWGLTLFFYRAEGEGEEEEEEDTLAPWLEERKPDGWKMAWERVDVELVGGCVESGSDSEGDAECVGAELLFRALSAGYFGSAWVWGGGGGGGVAWGGLGFAV